MDKKYEYFTNNELALLNAVVGNQAVIDDDERLFELWKEIAMVLDRRDLKDET